MFPRPVILATLPLDAARRGVLDTEFDLVAEVTDGVGVRGLMVDGAFVVDGALLTRLPDLEIVACIGTGYDNIDLESCTRRGIAVTNTAGANAEAVAELAIGLILSVLRGMGYGERLLRAGRWRGDHPRRFLEAPGLAGRRLGVFGMGAIGSCLTRRLAGFDIEIGYSGPRRKPDLAIPYFPDLESLAAWADLLVLTHRADDTNRGIVDADVLTALGPDGFLINVSRGSAINENALIQALQEGRIAGAGLDVFATEPDVHPDLLAMDGVVLTPHIGGGSRESFDRMLQVVGDNLRAYFSGQPLINPVIPVKA